MEEKQSITKYFHNAASVTVCNDDKKCLYFKGDDKFENVINEFLTICEDARDMPAYGVSLHNETAEAKKQGLWLELAFDSEQVFNEMPFESLLVHIEPQNQGFNLIRKYNGKYDGRCFYLSLNTTMKSLYESLLKFFEI